LYLDYWLKVFSWLNLIWPGVEHLIVPGIEVKEETSVFAPGQPAMLCSTY